MKQRLTTALSLLIFTSSVPALAEPSGVPADVKRVVDAFQGNWALDTTITSALMNEGKPIHFKEKFDCKKTARGYGVLCADSWSAPGMGEFEMTAIVGFGHQDKAVHFIGIESGGTIHDHKCGWKDEHTLECELYKGKSEDGQPMTEAVTVLFPDAKHMIFKVLVTNHDGTTLTVDAPGVRK